ncbi:acyl carrier protein [Legionella longbeachae]|uniref:Putative acyl carrier protein (ACP) n=1 Tax=Legionella longbeachae serogroup 1 (strain NSW150) TaxID=661367 RepID=D3HKR7_LEGLN|nr:acyl carrier protein [Legionella longbeachae]VEE03547.1 acyl carrier protein [Legionella oakridgensis]HBD7397824.1 acyl carrier protein [Legionella pneumophila]ARB93566.1 acyl carrier protein [Legionella longbeachae]ARM33297.1 acyl carrier protein [Legionella longbeachae]EEZ93837.1 putative acyl carrier protein [Legionella longbeachae D-4968]
MHTQRIRNVLERIGLNKLSEEPHAQLEQGGLDSLMLALLIIELEREFKIKIPVMPLVKKHYETIESIAKHLIDLGAQ